MLEQRSEHAAEAEAAVRSALDQSTSIEEVSGIAAEHLDAHGGMAARFRYERPFEATIP